MAKAYSDDLRRKFIEAHQQGEGSLEVLAQRFHVSVGWAKNVSAFSAAAWIKAESADGVIPSRSQKFDTDDEKAGRGITLALEKGKLKPISRMDDLSSSVHAFPYRCVDGRVCPRCTMDR